MEDHFVLEPVQPEAVPTDHNPPTAPPPLPPSPVSSGPQRKKSSSFQITKVQYPRRGSNDCGDDSNDEIDDSHTEDTSDITDSATDHPEGLLLYLAEMSNSGAEMNSVNAGGAGDSLLNRFTVVRSGEGVHSYKRGRWDVEDSFEESLVPEAKGVYSPTKVITEGAGSRRSSLVNPEGKQPDGHASQEYGLAQHQDMIPTELAATGGLSQLGAGQRVEVGNPAMNWCQNGGNSPPSADATEDSRYMKHDRFSGNQALAKQTSFDTSNSHVQAAMAMAVNNLTQRLGTILQDPSSYHEQQIIQPAANQHHLRTSEPGKITNLPPQGVQQPSEPFTASSSEMNTYQSNQNPAQMPINRNFVLAPMSDTSSSVTFTTATGPVHTTASTNCLPAGVCAPASQYHPAQAPVQPNCVQPLQSNQTNNDQQIHTMMQNTSMGNSQSSIITTNSRPAGDFAYSNQQMDQKTNLLPSQQPVSQTYSQVTRQEPIAPSSFMPNVNYQQNQALSQQKELEESRYRENNIQAQKTALGNQPTQYSGSQQAPAPAYYNQGGPVAPPNQHMVAQQQQQQQQGVNTTVISESTRVPSQPMSPTKVPGFPASSSSGNLASLSQESHYAAVASDASHGYPASQGQAFSAVHGQQTGTYAPIEQVPHVNQVPSYSPVPAYTQGHPLTSVATDSARNPQKKGNGSMTGSSFHHVASNHTVHQQTGYQAFPQQQGNQPAYQITMATQQSQQTQHVPQQPAVQQPFPQTGQGQPQHPVPQQSHQPIQASQHPQAMPALQPQQSVQHNTYGQQQSQQLQQAVRPTVHPQQLAQQPATQQSQHQPQSLSQHPGQQNQPMQQPAQQSESILQPLQHGQYMPQVQQSHTDGSAQQSHQVQGGGHQMHQHHVQQPAQPLYQTQPGGHQQTQIQPLQSQYHPQQGQCSVQQSVSNIQQLPVYTQQHSAQQVHPAVPQNQMQHQSSEQMLRALPTNTMQGPNYQQPLHAPILPPQQPTQGYQQGQQPTKQSVPSSQSYVDAVGSYPQQMQMPMYQQQTPIRAQSSIYQHEVSYQAAPVYSQNFQQGPQQTVSSASGANAYQQSASNAAYPQPEYQPGTDANLPPSNQAMSPQPRMNQPAFPTSQGISYPAQNAPYNPSTGQTVGSTQPNAFQSQIYQTGPISSGQMPQMQPPGQNQLMSQQVQPSQVQQQPILPSQHSQMHQTTTLQQQNQTHQSSVIQQPVQSAQPVLVPPPQQPNLTSATNAVTMTNQSHQQGPELTKTDSQLNFQNQQNIHSSVTKLQTSSTTSIDHSSRATQHAYPNQYQQQQSQTSSGTASEYSTAPLQQLYQPQYNPTQTQFQISAPVSNDHSAVQAYQPQYPPHQSQTQNVAASSSEHSAQQSYAAQYQHQQAQNTASSVTDHSATPAQRTYQPQYGSQQVQPQTGTQDRVPAQSQKAPQQMSQVQSQQHTVQPGGLAQFENQNVQPMLQAALQIQGQVLSFDFSDSAVGGNSVAIDNRIVQALVSDIVKDRLIHAVREEVDELKLKIDELNLRIRELENENSILRGAVAPELLSQIDSQKNSGANQN